MAKQLTILVDLSAIGSSKKNATDPADVAHNQGLRLRRILLKNRIEEQAKALNLRYHVGATAVLLRGAADAIEQLEIDDDIPVREASERYKPLRG